MPIILLVFKRFTKAVSKCHTDLPAVSCIMESSLGLLEVDASLCLLCVKDIANAQFHAAFIFQDLFNHSGGNLSHGLYQNLAFDSLCPVPSRQLRTPAFTKTELIVQV